jgi:hypothetical protein
MKSNIFKCEKGSNKYFTDALEYYFRLDDDVT